MLKPLSAVTNVVTHWLALSSSNQVYPTVTVSQSSWFNVSVAKWTFFGKVQYLGKRILEKYLPFVQDTCKNHLEDTKIRRAQQ